MGAAFIRTARGRQLRIDPLDLLWLRRAVAHEGEPRRLVAQVLLNRWAWGYDHAHGPWQHLRDLVRAYSQPVNPRWYPEGDLLRRKVAELTRAGELDQAREAMRRATLRRDNYQYQTAFAPEVEAAVRSAVLGPITLPPGAVHFAARTPRRFPVAIAERPGANGFYRDPEGRGSDDLYQPASGLEWANPPAWAAIPSVGRPSSVFGLIALMALGVFGAARALGLRT